MNGAFGRFAPGASFSLTYLLCHSIFERCIYLDIKVRYESAFRLASLALTAVSSDNSGYTLETCEK
jgi:hypothetical protein